MLDFKNVSLKHGTKTILTNVNLVVAPRKITTIIGPNGSGKTTMLKLLSQTLQPDQGRIVFADEKVAYLEQNNELFEPLTVTELLEIGLTNEVPDSEFMYRIIQRLGLVEMADQLVDELSGGQQQRVWLAYALCQRPDVILLDEPTAALDVHYQVELLNVLQEIQTEYNLTVVMVLHDLNQALHFSDFVWLVRGNGYVDRKTAQQCYDAELLSSVFQTPVQIIEIAGKRQVIVELS
ncbi:ABC transporter ATP-binding protein [Periweissella cryptocerci]|uniref:ABC transporter ATP-binding protein n=1 Tax=Periweissella cryptocerci TaxID=2506420 RepID=A0A4P6YS75_9LACO|nr:ABC transporter ATP-binding protein [Periweissella cryptocerci]QBO35529.1 ABC transporter ATP-binding protein [Periweissella cryptocerci]